VSPEYAKKLHGVLGFSGNGWTGESWIKLLFASNQVSLTKAWREWLRTNAAIAAGQDLPGEGKFDNKITSKQPAYYVFQTYENAEMPSKSGANPISDADPTPTTPVHYWEAYRTRGYDETKYPEESQRSETVTFP
jgi:hypothetical protein